MSNWVEFGPAQPAIRWPGSLQTAPITMRIRTVTALEGGYAGDLVNWNGKMWMHT